VRRTASAKMEMIRRVEGTDLPVRATLRQMGVPRSTFYGGYQRYEEIGRRSFAKERRFSVLRECVWAHTAST
jgi:putative transposase